MTERNSMNVNWGRGMGGIDWSLLEGSTVSRIHVHWEEKYVEVFGTVSIPRVDPLGNKYVDVHETMIAKFPRTDGPREAPVSS